MSLTLQETSVEERIAAAFFLSGSTRRQDLENVLKPCNVTPHIVKETKGKADFLKEMGAGDFDGLALIILDLVGQKDQLGFAREVTARCSPRSRILALGDKNDVTFFRSLREIGIGDYLIHPVPWPVLLRSVEALLGRKHKERGGHCVAFYCTHGGSGCGLLAAGVATYISTLQGRDTICGDTDFATPCVGHHLGIDRAGDLATLLNVGDRLDESLVRQASYKVYDNLSLLTSFDPTREILPGENAVAARLVELLRGMHRYQIWRVAGTGALAREVLFSADVINVIVTGTLASAAAARNMLALVRENNPQALLIQVFNAVAPHQSLTPQMLSQVTGRDNQLVIPYKKSLGKDLAVNVPLKDRRHSMFKSFAELCSTIVSVGAEDVGRGGLGI